jgi:putative ABC transport system substrate-binding protein
MKRREFIAGAISMVAAPPLAAQPVANSRRLAIFSISESNALMNERSENRYYRVLFAELRRLGHVEGQNLTVERYGREESTAGVAAMAAQVVRSNPDVVYVVGAGAPVF